MYDAVESESNPFISDITNAPDINKIIELTKISRHRIWNIYMFGSRVYGTYREDSDYDIILVASSLDCGKEIKDKKYNIHIVSPDQFEDGLRSYNMSYLECIFAPDFAKLQERRSFPLEIRSKFFKKQVIRQSSVSWNKAEKRIEDGEIFRGIKSLFHSFRILSFGLQIVSSKRIDSFSSYNRLWDEISNNNDKTWKAFKDRYYKERLILENRFRNTREHCFNYKKKVENSINDQIDAFFG
jgi:predicted nucleotidyltransferase